MLMGSSLVSGGNLTFPNSATDSVRSGKVFSLFTVVQFPNDVCTTSSTSFTKGTCFSSSECNTKGGTAYGNCAAGFGVCCVVSTSTCGTTFSTNCTYVTNPGFPAAYTTTLSCVYTVSKLSSDICQLRLDFATLALVVSTATGTAGSCSSIIGDSLTVAGQTGSNPPVVCGINTGYHMYVDTGTAASDTVKLTFGLTATTGASRHWNVKVSQIECTASYRCGSGCTQCYTGATGSIASYGFGTAQMLQSQQYSACVRQEYGYCSIAYSQSTTASPDPFEMDNAGIASTGESTADACTTAYIKIPGGSFGGATAPKSAQLCGSVLGPDATAQSTPYTTSQLPFRVDVLGAATAISPATGFNLDYQQLACS